MFVDRLAASISDRRRGRRLKGQRGGFSLIELLIVIAIILVILTVAIPKFSKAVMGAREAGAMKAISTIHTAEVQYYSSYNRFAASLQELGPPASGADGPSAAGLIERDLASGEKGGYKYTLTVTPTGYAISAVPIHYGTDGSKTFYSDEGMGLHVHNGQEPATANDQLQGQSAPTQQQPAK